MTNCLNADILKMLAALVELLENDYGLCVDNVQVDVDTITIRFDENLE